MTAAVTLTDVSVRFGRREILHSLCAAFPTSGISVLVGRSGSGKTTLLRTINRLNEEFDDCTTTGTVTVRFGDEEISLYAPLNTPGSSKISLPALRARIGMLFQTPHLFPVSIFQNIALPLQLVRNIPKQETADRIEHALRSVGLWHEVRERLQHPAESLSGGQQQRLCLARVLALQPSLLLLDEPTASLDVHATNAIEELLLELSAHYSIIMVSHSIQQAKRLAKHVLVCEAGRIHEQFISPDLLTEEMLALSCSPAARVLFGT